jgi:hypothetical protein
MTMAKYTITIEGIEPSGYCLGGIKLETSITQDDFDIPFSEKPAALMIAEQTYHYAIKPMKVGHLFGIEDLIEGAEQ